MPHANGQSCASMVKIAHWALIFISARHSGSDKIALPKYDPRRYHRSGTLNKKIVGGLLLFTVVIFLALIIRGVF